MRLNLMKVNMEQNKIYTNLLSKTTLKRNVTIILRPFPFSLKMPFTEDEAIIFFLLFHRASYPIQSFIVPKNAHF
jgi:hypothetical protein